MKKIKDKIYKLLIRSQKYAGTDMIYLARGSFWLTLGQIVSMAASFLLALAFANLLPKETYGIYKYILSMAGILAYPTLASINTALKQAIARGYEGSLILGLKTRFRWGTLGSLGSLVIAGYYFYNGNLTLTIAFLIVALFTPIMDSLTIYISMLHGKKLFDVSSKYGMIRETIPLLILISSLFLTNNLFVILLAYFISNTLSRFILLKLTLRKYPPNKKVDPQTISYGKHLTLTKILGPFAKHLDSIILWHFLGPIEVAIYSFAMALPDQAKGFSKTITALAFPKFSQKPQAEIKNVLMKKVLKYFLATIPIAGVFILLAPFVYKLFFPQYLESIFYSQIYALTILLIPSGLIGTYFQSQIKKKELYILRYASSIFRIISLLALIPFFGILGAVIARLSMQLFSLGLSIFLFKKS